MLPFLNVLFFVVHTLWIAFNCCGWAWRRTRPWHLVTVTLTALSWFVLGSWYGWGYCVCTDWHWQVREQLGYARDASYMQLLFLKLTGIDVDRWLADTVTGGVFAVVVVLSLVLNVRDFLHRRRLAKQPHLEAQRRAGSRERPEDSGRSRDPARLPNPLQ